MKLSKGLAALASAAVVVALLPAVSTAAGAAVPTCQGHRATIVGHPDLDGELHGTPRADVIVTRGIGHVDAGRGDDRICVTGTNSARAHDVAAGRGDDRVVVATSRPDDVDAGLGAGDDVLTMQGLPDDRLVDVSGGPGLDAFGAEESQALSVDLAAGAAWDDTGSAEAPDVRLDGFEGAGGVATTVRLDGDAGDNVLDAYGCDVIARGGAGADLLRTTRVPDTLSCEGDVPGVAFHGGVGPDVLTGGSGADHLFGDEGRDRANGRGGPDLCLAEVMHSCER